MVSNVCQANTAHPLTRRLMTFCATVGCRTKSGVAPTQTAPVRASERSRNCAQDRSLAMCRAWPSSATLARMARLARRRSIRSTAVADCCKACASWRRRVSVAPSALWASTVGAHCRALSQSLPGRCVPVARLPTSTAKARSGCCCGVWRTGSGMDGVVMVHVSRLLCAGDSVVW